MRRLVLLRHGESQWNRENRFTGWTDIDLSEKGIEEAASAGRAMKEAGLRFDAAYTSVLKRAIRTLWLSTEQMDLLWIPWIRSWRLNERHYGALQGLDKAETAAKFGAEQVKLWRRSYAVRPPALAPDDPRSSLRDPRYEGVSDIPLAESLKDTTARFYPLWEKELLPAIRAGKRLLIAAHGNSLRALVKILERVSDDDVVKLEIPTGVPLVYELDDDSLELSGRRLQLLP